MKTTFPRMTSPTDMNEDAVLDRMREEKMGAYTALSKRLAELHEEFGVLYAQSQGLPSWSKRVVEAKMNINRELRDEVCRRLLLVT